MRSQDVHIARRAERNAVQSKAMRRANLVALLLATPVGLVALFTHGGTAGMDLAAATYVLTFLVGSALPAIASLRHARREPIELSAGLVTLSVGQMQLQLATLQWRRKGWADLILVDGDRRVDLEELADRTAVERFLDAHIERARSRHGVGEDEVPRALRRQREAAAERR